MRLPQDYDSAPLVDAITDLDWSRDHARDATRVVQSIILERYGEQLDDEDAAWLLGSLLNRRLIRAQIHPDAGELIPMPGSKLRPKAKYVKIPPRNASLA